MSSSLLDQLRQMTIVVADTGDIQAIEKFRPRDATTNPSLITAAAQMPEYQQIVDETLLEAKHELGSGSTDIQIASLAFDRLAISFGKRILEIVPKRVSTEVDARLSYDTDATISKGRYLISEYEKTGVTRDRVLIKIASTWEGIKAAEVLEKDGIHCNLTLLFGFHQAVACAEANVTLISPFVGRILDWYRHETGLEYQGPDDPGVQSVTSIYNYFKKYDYPTEVMGASFRNIDEIVELAGCDLLTISPALLMQLETTIGTLTRKLSPESYTNLNIPRLQMDQTIFQAMHTADRMASEKLSEGILGFSKALECLETLLSRRLTQLESGAKVGDVMTSLFNSYDMDCDGYISREEWFGTDSVFDAIDIDHDGRITPVELGRALGAVLSFAAQ